MSLLNDIRDYLIAQGIGGAYGSSWPIYEGYMPDDVDPTIGVFETGGMPADTLGRENRRPTFQLRLRAARQDYATARTKWDACFAALQDARQTAGSPTLLPGVIFIQTMHTGPMVFNDDQGRVNMTLNCRVLLTV